MEGYEEVEILNPLDSGILKVIKSCNNCQYKKNILTRSGKNPEYSSICDHQDCDRYSKLLHKNVYGYYEPPGFYGEECPFHQQLLREKKLKNLLP